MEKHTAEIMQPIRQHMEAYVNDWIGEHNTQFVERLEHLSSAMHCMEKELARCNEEELAHLVQSGADSIDSISRQVKQGDARDLIEILEHQGRDHPAGALLASMTAGFLSTRAVRHKDGGDTGRPDGNEQGDGYQYSPDSAQADLRFKEGG